MNIVNESKAKLIDQLITGIIAGNRLAVGITEKTLKVIDGQRKDILEIIGSMNDQKLIEFRNYCKESYCK